MATPDLDAAADATGGWIAETSYDLVPGSMAPAGQLGPAPVSFPGGADLAITLTTSSPGDVVILAVSSVHQRSVASIGGATFFRLLGASITGQGPGYCDPAGDPEGGASGTFGLEIWYAVLGPIGSYAFTVTLSSSIDSAIVSCTAWTAVQPGTPLDGAPSAQFIHGASSGGVTATFSTSNKNETVLFICADALTTFNNIYPTCLPPAPAGWSTADLQQPLELQSYDGVPADTGNAAPFLFTELATSYKQFPDGAAGQTVSTGHSNSQIVAIVALNGAMPLTGATVTIGGGGGVPGVPGPGYTPDFSNPNPPTAPTTGPVVVSLPVLQCLRLPTGYVI